MSPVVRHEDVVCPFCALGCDDLIVSAEGDRLTVESGAPPACAGQFAASAGDPSPRVGGQPVSLDAACARAAEILAASRLPLIDGLATDTDGVRAALRLAERVGGIIDHAQSGPLLANLRVMQTGGWVTGTLAEIRTRAELVLMFGTDAVRLMPRFFERVVWPEPAPAAAPATRQVVLLGPGLNAAAAMAPASWADAPAVELIACPVDGLAVAAAVLRALVQGHRLPPGDIAGMPRATLDGLATRLLASPYCAIVWAAGELPQADAELTVSSLAELLKALNGTTRAIGLPLAGPGNIIGANQVTGWSWGVPLRSRIVAGRPDYAPDSQGAAALLAAGLVDARLWLSSFTGEPPAVAGDLPTVALIRAGTRFAREPEVVIPVATPGLDHPGALFRTDSVVALPVRALRQTTHPRAADVLDAIARQLPRREAA